MSKAKDYIYLLGHKVNSPGSNNFVNLGLFTAFACLFINRSILYTILRKNHLVIYIISPKQWYLYCKIYNGLVQLQHNLFPDLFVLLTHNDILVIIILNLAPKVYLKRHFYIWYESFNLYYPITSFPNNAFACSKYKQHQRNLPSILQN